MRFVVGEEAMMVVLLRIVLLKLRFHALDFATKRMISDFVLLVLG